MDKPTLVEREIDGGQKVVELLVSHDFDVAAAFWVKPSEEDRWLFFVVSKVVDEQGLSAAYRAAHAALQGLPDREFWLEELHLVGTTDPAASDVLELQNRSSFPGSVPDRIWRPQLGGRPIDEAYVYPPATSPFPGFDEIKKHFPSATAFALTVPNRLTLSQDVAPYMGRINDSEFEGRAAETVLFIGPASDSSESLAKLVFVHRPEGWNTLFRAETNSWEQVRLPSGEKLYKPTDFGPLAAMKAGGHCSVAGQGGHNKGGR